MKTRLIIVAAPSGAGKNSFVERVCREVPLLVDNITYTTRSMRMGEVPGNPYHFINLEDFEKKVEMGFFVEWARVHTHFYGTSYESLEKAWLEKKTVIMDIDVQGTSTFKAKFPDAKTIFILPPSIEELRRRVLKRDGQVPLDMEVRMANAEKEMLEAPFFDFQVVNGEFEKSFQEFKNIIEKLIGEE